MKKKKTDYQISFVIVTYRAFAYIKLIVFPVQRICANKKRKFYTRT